MNKIITAPEEIKTAFGVPVIFLAGTIEGGNSHDWQEELAKILAEKYTVLNPRRKEWIDLGEEEMKRQIHWERSGLHQANKILMYLDPMTKSPISLLEFGMFVKSGKLIVVCPEGFYRKQNVKITAELYGCPVFDTLEHALSELL